MRYEAFVLRDLKSASCEWLRVSHTEWISFAGQSLENGFYAVAAKVPKILAVLCMLLTIIRSTDETTPYYFNFSLQFYASSSFILTQFIALYYTWFFSTI